MGNDAEHPSGNFRTTETTDQWTRRQLLHASALATIAPLGGAESKVASAGSDATSRLTANAKIALTINGRSHQLDLDIRTSLLDLLREHLGLTGTKKGCNQGACGACTVLVNGRRINACLALAAMYDGAQVTTIEGLARTDGLHALQTAFIEHDAFQCGYCTSGQILSGVACIAEGHANSIEEIRTWMSGNICRCGAYPGICAAIAQAARGSGPVSGSA